MFKDMIHGIHRGDERESPITLYSGVNSSTPGGTSTTILDPGYPGILSNCSQCHADGTWTLGDTRDWAPSQYPIYTCSEDPTLDLDLYCTDPYWTSTIVYRPPVQAACNGCHDSEAAMAHSELNTTDDGDEACAVCHGPGAEFEAHPE
jgi:OmcA/MtrC family decaheme c-type cytochrome